MNTCNVEAFIHTPVASDVMNDLILNSETSQILHDPEPVYDDSQLDMDMVLGPVTNLADETRQGIGSLQDQVNGNQQEIRQMENELDEISNQLDEIDIDIGGDIEEASAAAPEEVPAAPEEAPAALEEAPSASEVAPAASEEAPVAESASAEETGGEETPPEAVSEEAGDGANDLDEVEGEAEPTFAEASGEVSTSEEGVTTSPLAGTVEGEELAQEMLEGAADEVSVEVPVEVLSRIIESLISSDSCSLLS